MEERLHGFLYFGSQFGRGKKPDIHGVVIVFFYL